jgi:hypothetical protein
MEGANHRHANHLRPYNIEVDQISCSLAEMFLMTDECDECDELVRDRDYVCNFDCCDIAIDYCSVVYDRDTFSGEIEETDPVASRGNVPNPLCPVAKLILMNCVFYQ